MHKLFSLIIYVIQCVVSVVHWIYFAEEALLLTHRIRVTRTGEKMVGCGFEREKEESESLLLSSLPPPTHLSITTTSSPLPRGHRQLTSPLGRHHLLHFHADQVVVFFFSFTRTSPATHLATPTTYLTTPMTSGNSTQT
ncbi:hypothetical protein Hdeb2414_s0007g00244761 [Helianthus debilis subsp. tardiflorus]